ncbi:hypothetical protein [Dysgonomonas macrotermitis]|uniref:Uncharacterized protein n=1 Tax=Dysgonomonas macrotermitis TaxID=1346286 RepID=A0A1M4VV04_9BACT|nr:hypothetical protein [Dysgonomonas macrotermitis]SHE72789.1 hypothetical protein SAMN05444362_10249 [Dysgonomonas macrotermitis]
MKAQSKTFILFIISFFIVFYSCEYVSDDVYNVDIKQKSDSIDININLANVNPNDTIIIYERTKLYYRVDSKGKNILKNVISIDSEFEYVEDYIVLYPKAYDNSVHKLTVDVELKSHTGSISDLLGYEKYVGKYEYYVKFIKLTEEFEVNLQGGFSEEGFLKLHWEKPILDNAYILKYTLSFLNDVKGEYDQIEIADPDITSFIDRSYFWGHRTYTLSVEYKNKDVNYINSETFYFIPKYKELEDPVFKYEIIDNETMRVYWDLTNYNCKYLLIDANGEQNQLAYNQKSIVIQRFRFPADANRFTFYMLPYDLPYEQYDKGIAIGVNLSYAEGQMTAPLALNMKKNEYYFYDHFGQLIVYNISNFSLKKRYTLPEINGYNKTAIASNETTSQIAIYKYTWPTPTSTYNIYIYSNNRYEEPFVLADKLIEDNLYLTDNYRLFFTELEFNSDLTELINKCYAYNSQNGDLIYSIELMGRESNISISRDGKYLSEVYKGHLKIYELRESSAQLIYNYTNDNYRYSLCQFSSVNPHELLLGGGDNFLVFDIPSLTQKVNVKGDFVAQDPVNGNMVILDKDYTENFIANIYDKDLSRIMGRLPLNKFDGSWYFLNNRLIYADFQTYYIDLTNYIK